MAHPHLAYKQNRARQIAHGTWQPWADPAHVRDHVHRLLQTATFQAVAGAARVGEKTVWEIAHGTRPVIKTETAHALLAVQPADVQPPRADANGAMWRLRSLIAMGHTARRITTALCSASHVIEPLIRGERATVTTPLRDDINRLFDAWWDKRPPRRTPAEKAAACRALQRAAVHNWPCPAALDEDELDLPGYKPAGRWRYATGTGVAADDPLGKHRHQATAPGPAPAAAEPARRTRTAVGYPRPEPEAG
jgi:hypothetical protein